MDKYFISFGTTHNYSNSLERIKQEALALQFFDKVIVYTENDFDKNYLDKHGEFMKSNKGYGFWMWKSYFVKKTLDRMIEGDILVFADCGCHIVNNPVAINRLNTYIKICNSSDYGCFSFQMCFPEKSYTKMDVFEKLGELNNKMMSSGQLVGGIFILRKCQRTIDLINEYYELCQDYKLIDDSESVLPNDQTFVAHRHDQSVFSILRKKRGCVMVPDETWFNNFMSPEAQSKPILATRIRY